jgi:hypothetical protein
MVGAMKRGKNKCETRKNMILFFEKYKCEIRRRIYYLKKHECKVRGT